MYDVKDVADSFSSAESTSNDLSPLLFEKFQDLLCEGVAARDTVVVNCHCLTTTTDEHQDSRT